VANLPTAKYRIHNRKSQIVDPKKWYPGQGSNLWPSD
jgi:hypothetical protein